MISQFFTQLQIFPINYSLADQQYRSTSMLLQNVSCKYPFSNLRVIVPLKSFCHIQYMETVLLECILLIFTSNVADYSDFVATHQIH